MVRWEVLCAISSLGDQVLEQRWLSEAAAVLGDVLPAPIAGERFLDGI